METKVQQGTKGLCPGGSECILLIGGVAAAGERRGKGKGRELGVEEGAEQGNKREPCIRWKRCSIQVWGVAGSTEETGKRKEVEEQSNSETGRKVNVIGRNMQ